MQKQKRNHKDMTNKSGAKRTNKDRGIDAGNRRTNRRNKEKHRDTYQQMHHQYTHRAGTIQKQEAESNIWHMRVLSTIQNKKMTKPKIPTMTH